MTTDITWPEQTATPVPLPNLGLCGACEGEIRIRGNGLLYAHDCDGDGSKPAARLEPTFARWLWMQSKRRDDYTNRLTLLAGRQFRGCTRSPKLTPVDVDWATAEELHDRLHETQLRLTGSDVRQPYNGKRCDWMCRDIAEAAGHYARLLLAAA